MPGLGESPLERWTFDVERFRARPGNVERSTANIQLPTGGLQTPDRLHQRLGGDAEVLPDFHVALGRGDARVDDADVLQGNAARRRKRTRPAKPRSPLAGVSMMPSSMVTTPPGYLAEQFGQRALGQRQAVDDVGVDAVPFASVSQASSARNAGAPRASIAFFAPGSSGSGVIGFPVGLGLPQRGRPVLLRQDRAGCRAGCR